MGVLAFAIPIAAILAWTRGTSGSPGWERPTQIQRAFSTIMTRLVFCRTPPTAIFSLSNTELHRDIDGRGNSSASVPAKPGSMVRKSLEIFRQHPIATAVVMGRGFLLVATVPDRNELNDVIGTHGAGPFGLPPSADVLIRVRNMLHSPLLTMLVLLQLVVILFVWTGVWRAILRIGVHSKSEASLLWIPFSLALLMLACAAGPDAQARFRVPAVPFLAMLAGIGWLGTRADEASSSEIAAHDPAMAPQPVVS